MQQMREAFPWDQPCRYLLRDRDTIYGGDWVAMTKDLGMEEVISAPRSPWQNPYVERLIGSIRRECLDHIIVWNERSLRRTLKDYFAYYQRSRTPFGIDQGCSGVESSGEARKRVHRRDSSAWRTPSRYQRHAA
jgi:putative transposase